MSELVSIITTVKNGENTLKDTIDSVLKQTYRNFEMIIVDDGSTDKTLELLYEYEKYDSRILVYPSKSIGRPKALNKAIKISNGKYLAILDADDLFHPRKIELQVKIINRYNDYLLLGTKAEIIYENENPKWEEIIDNSTISSIDKSIHYRNFILHSSVLIDKSMFEELGFYDESRKSLVDYELWLRAFTKDKKMGVIDKELIAKRIHSNQSFENKKRFNYTYNTFKLQVSYLLKNSKYIYYFPITLTSFILAQFPFSIRRKITNKIFN